MKYNSRSSSDSDFGNKQQAKETALYVRVACCVLLVAALTGCESLQRKFTRKPKHPGPAPTPIVSFQDYTQAMTPLDRYRKHSVLFDYWNDELLEALQQSTVNPKRFKKASSESLAELGIMKDLLLDDVAARLTPLIEERAHINRQLQSPAFNTSQATTIGRVLERHTRQIHREFLWRDVEDKLKAPSP